MNAEIDTAPLNSSMEMISRNKNINNTNRFLRTYTTAPKAMEAQGANKFVRKLTVSEASHSELNKIEKLKKSLTKAVEKEVNTNFSFKTCWRKLKSSVNTMLGSPYAMVIVLLCTFFALFNFDMKLLLTDEAAEPVFALVNNIIFFLLTMEFVLLIMFESRYVGSFDFYLDALAVLSLIPDTPLIIGHGSMDSMTSTSHLVNASSASQAGAR